MKTKHQKKVAPKPIKELHKDQQLYYSLAKEATSTHYRKSQHQRVLTLINHQIKRPETSYAMRKDYRGLLCLADCNKKIHQSKQKSMKYSKKINHLKQNSTAKELFLPLEQEIRNSSITVNKKKQYHNSLKNGLKSLKETFYSSGEKRIKKKHQTEMSDLKAIILEKYKLDEKFCLFGDLVEDEKEQYLKKIKEFLESPGQSRQSMSDSQKKYVINHYLLQKLLQKSYKNTQILKLKNKFRDTYQQMKKEMVEQLIQQDNTAEIFDKIQKYEKGKRQSLRKSAINQQLNNFSQIKLKQNENIKYFEKVYEIAAEKINQAMKKFQAEHPQTTLRSHTRNKQNKWLY